MAKRRNPLAKERFLEGNRQRWAVLLILCGGGILFANSRISDFDPEPYLTFLTMIGCVFLLGMSADSVMKIRKQPPPDQPPADPDEIEEEVRG